MVVGGGHQPFFGDKGKRGQARPTHRVLQHGMASHRARGEQPDPGSLASCAPTGPPKPSARRHAGQTIGMIGISRTTSPKNAGETSRAGKGAAMDAPGGQRRCGDSAADGRQPRASLRQPAHGRRHGCSVDPDCTGGLDRRTLMLAGGGRALLAAGSKNPRYPASATPASR